MAATTNIYGFNIGGNNNSFDQRGHFYRAFLSGNVSGMVVKQNSTPNMTVLVEHGSALLNKNTTSASVAEIKADTSVTVDTANTANPRIDTVVIYEDTSVAIPTVEANYWQDGAGGRFKIVSLPGTAAASPVALSDANVQSAIGAGKPWARLADITVPANSTTILNSNIADRRAKLGGAIPDASITAAKLDSAAFPKFRAKLTTADTVGNGAFKKVVFNLEDYDIGNNFASSRFTASVAGYYHFASALHVSGGVTLLILSFYKNGVEVARGDRLQGMSSSSVGASAATDIYLAVGDYVEVFCQANSAASIETSGATTIFSGHMIP